MQKNKYISCIYHTTLFFCSKRGSTKFYILVNNEDSQQKRATTNYHLQQIYAINHSADIVCKDFMKIYRKRTSEPCFFLAINTALPGDNFLRFRKNLLDPLLKLH